MVLRSRLMPSVVCSTGILQTRAALKHKKKHLEIEHEQNTDVHSITENGLSFMSFVNISM